MTNYLPRAVKIALRSSHQNFFHGAMVFKGSNLLATGFNHEQRHAERNALDKIWPDKRIGCTVISVRVTKTGLLANGKPCSECEQYLKDSGIKHVLYSTADRQMARMRL